MRGAGRESWEEALQWSRPGPRDRAAWLVTGTGAIGLAERAGQGCKAGPEPARRCRLLPKKGE